MKMLFHQFINKTLRLCPLGHDHVETEEHFLIVCSHLTALRNAMFQKVADIIPNFLSFIKFTVLLTRENLIYCLGPYVLKSFKFIFRSE